MGGLLWWLPGEVCVFGWAGREGEVNVYSMHSNGLKLLVKQCVHVCVCVCVWWAGRGVKWSVCVEEGDAVEMWIGAGSSQVGDYLIPLRGFALAFLSHKH